MKTLCIISLTIIILTGCSRFYPLPLKESATLTCLIEGKAKKDNSNKCDNDINDDVHLGLTKAFVNIRDEYMGNTVDRYKESYKSDDVSYSGGLISLVGGATKSVGAVIGGGSLAAGGDILPARYQLRVQGNMYYQAAKTFDCMNQKLNFLVGKELLEKDVILVEEVAKIASTVRFKLFESLLTVGLQRPSGEELVAAINAEKTTEEEDKIKDPQGIANFNKTTDSGQKEEARNKKRDHLLAKLNLCVNENFR